MRLTLTCAFAEDESINFKKRSWNNGTPLTKQLRYNKLRLFVGISSKRKEKVVDFWETQKSCVIATTLLLSHFWQTSQGIFVFMFDRNLLISMKARDHPSCILGNAQVWLFKNSWARVCQKPRSSRLCHGGCTGELDILKTELLLQVHVHGKPVNYNRIPSSAQNINFSTPLHISTDSFRIKCSDSSCNWHL